MDIEAEGKAFRNVTKINILLGKNGSGKSTFLRHFDQYKDRLPNMGNVRYITPERGGELQYQGHIETSLANSPSWGSDVRRSNRFENFRQLSVSEFRRLETLVLRKIEKDPATRRDATFTFESTLASINELLDNVKIARSDATGFDITNKDTPGKREPGTLSSGESELISLGIEILAFAYRSESHPGLQSYLFLDEPDVHLHPDLQSRLVKLIVDSINGRDITVFIATHSTAVLGALSNNMEASVGFLSSKETTIVFSRIDESLRKILPIFGAHPLSNIFNERPILLVEGEDDERIWQQAVRTSQGKLKIWPCEAGDIQSLNEYENQVEAIAGSVYENATAYSLRDRDDAPYEIDDKPIVKRMRLFCRASENLLLSDDVLNSLGTNWEKMKASITEWLEKYPNHPQHLEMEAFKNKDFERKTTDVKALCNIFMMLAAARKPWEIAVGQAIAGLLVGPASKGDDSLTAYLGPKLIDALRLKFKPRLGFPQRPRG
jgi:energy-coupling factor transporter ATP-binding protein EcfA2